MKTNPNDPAFQSFERFEKEIEGSETKIDVLIPTGGLTKREIFAAMAMNGLCHDYGRNSCVETGTHENIAMISVKLADALIQKLNEGKENEIYRIQKSY